MIKKGVLLLLTFKPKALQKKNAIPHVLGYL